MCCVLQERHIFFNIVVAEGRRVGRVIISATGALTLRAALDAQDPLQISSAVADKVAAPTGPVCRRPDTPRCTVLQGELLVKLRGASERTRVHVFGRHASAPVRAWPH